MHYPPRGAGQAIRYLSWRWVAAALRLTNRRAVLCIKAGRRRRGGAVSSGKNGAVPVDKERTGPGVQAVGVSV